MTTVLGRYDAAAIQTLFAEAGVLRALEQRGFSAHEVTVESAGGTLAHTRLFACKAGERHLLLDAILLEAAIPPEFFAARGYAMASPMELVVIYWLREEDPTAAFSAERPALPLQQHPGLGILRRAFQVVVRMARELGKDGVASLPKFFHDAVIFYRSRLFLFLDGAEQGGFEALARDLEPLSLGDASLALVGGCVQDATDRVAHWRPGLQVLPLSAAFAGYFHSTAYTVAVARAFAQGRFLWDPARVVLTRATLAGAQQVGENAAPKGAS